MNSNQIEEIRNTFFKLRCVYFFQGIAYLLLFIILVLYFHTTETVINSSQINFQDSSSKIIEIQKFIKYGSFTAIGILLISACYLITIDVRNVIGNHE